MILCQFGMIAVDLRAVVMFGLSSEEQHSALNLPVESAVHD